MEHIQPRGGTREPSDAEYEHLLAFRTEMRGFIRWSEQQAQAVGLTHLQHQLLLAVRGHADVRGPTQTEVGTYLLMSPSSVAELVDRAESAGHLQRRRDDVDGRVVRLALTPRGERELAQLTTLVLAELRRLSPVLRQVLADAAGRPPSRPDRPGEPERNQHE